MAQDAFEDLHDHRRRRRVNKRGNRKRRKLLQNVRWIIGEPSQWDLMRPPSVLNG